MDEVSGILCGLFFLLVFMTVLGHGLWLLVAALGRAIFGNQGPRGSASAPGVPCANCGNPTSVVGNRCQVCGAPAQMTAEQQERVELFAIRRRLNRWAASGQLPEQVQQTLTQLLQADEQRIQSRPFEPSPSAAEFAAAQANQPFATPVNVASSTPPPTLALSPTLAPTSPFSATPASRIPPATATRHPLDEPVIVAEIVPATEGLEPSVRHAYVATSGPAGAAIPPPAPLPARRALADMLHAFMEDKNIRWAEIVSGILIVVSAVGLVISLRATLKEKIPYFPALSFMMLTAAIHAAGIYSLKRWNLKQTSRGVLIIATLLVPLSFLAAIVLSGNDEQQRPATDPTYLLAVAIGTLSFGAMNYFAARALVRHGWWRLMVAVLGTSLSQLLIHRLQPAVSSPLAATLLLSPAVLAFVVPVVSSLVLSVRRSRLGPRPTHQFFLELGISSFALLAPIGMFLARATSATESLGDLSPILSISACTILAAGLVAHRRIADPELAGFRMAGTSIALFGGGVMLLLVAFAWPQLELLCAVGLINFVLLTGLAVAGELSVLHVPAVGCLALAFLSGFHLWYGIDTGPSSLASRIARAIFAGRSAAVLTAFAALAAAAGITLRKRQRSDDGLYYLMASGGVGLLCVAVAIYAGFVAPYAAQGDLASPLLLIYAIAALTAGWIVCRTEATVLGTALLAIGIFHALWANEWLKTRLADQGWELDRPLVLSLLCHSLLASLIAAIALARAGQFGNVLAKPLADAVPATRIRSFALPLSFSGILSSAGTALLTLGVTSSNYGTSACYLAGASLAWLTFSFLRAPAVSFAVFQSLASAAIVYATTAVCTRQPWWDGNLWSAKHLQVQVAVLAAWCAAWPLARRILQDRSWSAHWGSQTWSVDKVLLGLLVIAAVGMAFLGFFPGTMVELGLPGLSSSDVNAASAHRLWYGPGAWWGIGLLALALIASLWERFFLSLETLAGSVAASVAVPLLIAGHFDDHFCVASAGRWLFAIFGVVWCIPACYWGGRRSRGAHSTAANSWLSRPADVMRINSLVFSLAAVLVLTTLAVISVAAGNVPGGPAAGSLFARMGSSASYATPLAVMVVVLAAYAVREAKPGYAFGASLVFQYAISLACLLPVFSAGAPFDTAAIAKLLQWNFFGLAVFTALWISVLHLLEPNRQPMTWPPAGRTVLGIQIGMLFAVQLIVVAWIATVMFVDPTRNWVATIELGSWPSYVALAFSCGGICWLTRRGPIAGLTHGVCASLLVLVHLIAATVQASATGSLWWGHHALGAGRVALAAAIVAWVAVLTRRLLSVKTPLSQVKSHGGLEVAESSDATADIGLRDVSGSAARVAVAERSDATAIDSPDQPYLSEVIKHTPDSDVQTRRTNSLLHSARRAAVAWGSVVIGLVVLAAMRGAASDPLRPGWPAGLIVAAALLTSTLGISLRSEWFGYPATLLAGLSASVLWIGLGSGHPLRHDLNFVAFHVLVVTIAALAWLGWEIFFQRRGEWGVQVGGTLGLATGAIRPPPARRVLPVHHAVSYLFLALCLVDAIGSSFRLCLGDPVSPLDPAERGFVVAAWISLLALYVGSLWDRRATYSLVGLYVWCLAVAAFSSARLPISPMAQVTTFLGMVATQIALSGWLWSWGSKLAVIGQRLGIHDPIEGLRRVARWLPIATLVLAAGVTLMCFDIVLSSMSRELRVAAACLPLLLAVGTAGLSQQQRRDTMQLLSLMFLAIAGVLLGWSDIAPGWTDTVALLRSIRLLMALCAVAFLYGVVAVRVLTDVSGWRPSARRAAVVVGGFAGAALLTVLGLEFATFEPNIGAPVDTVQLLAVSAVMVALVVALISLAVLPGRDPLQLSESGRMAYVYAAQVVAALLFAHLYLAKPALFAGMLRPYWPYIVVVIAFAGVGVGELFQRLNLRVLSEPFQRSGAFLPLVPAIGMWVVHSGSDYSVVLFAVGVLYLLLSFAQRSLLAGIASAVAGNGALWSLFNGTEDLTFSQHPQFWLIPPAVSVLIAAQLNRTRLSEAQLAAIRYVSVSLIYLSSLVEMLRIGIGESLWPPLVLIAIAIAGMFFGIAMQVRAFLFLGAIFVLVGMISMVAHAARSIHHSWPWWAFSILMGVMILVVFGWFEGRRTQIMALIDRMRQWEK